MVNKANIKRREQLKSSYEINKRESEIGMLNIINSNQKRWVIGLIIGISILLFLSYLLFRGNKFLSLQKKIITKKEQEKALLLKELNHRVKNNLQMISSLLNLQSKQLKGHPAEEAITDGKYRVEALSLVHKKLYQEGVDTKIEIKEYIEELVLGLFHSYDATFKPDFKIVDISIKIDFAIPIALIINELISNALKYAYKNINTPTLSIEINQKKKDHLYIDIRDNGIGFSTQEIEQPNSFGLQLITSLVEQLEGSIEKVSKKGTCWNLIIKTV